MAVRASGVINSAGDFSDSEAGRWPSASVGSVAEPKPVAHKCRNRRR